MEANKIRVVGGALKQEKLNSTMDAQTYDACKAHVWLLMLKDKMVPTKWGKPTKKGTRIAFSYPQTQQEWDDSLSALNEYIASVNAKHGLDLNIG